MHKRKFFKNNSTKGLDHFTDFLTQQKCIVLGEKCSFPVTSSKWNALIFLYFLYDNNLMTIT